MGLSCLIVIIVITPLGFWFQQQSVDCKWKTDGLSGHEQVSITTFLKSAASVHKLYHKINKDASVHAASRWHWQRLKWKLSRYATYNKTAATICICNHSKKYGDREWSLCRQNPLKVLWEWEWNRVWKWWTVSLSCIFWCPGSSSYRSLHQNNRCRQCFICFINTLLVSLPIKSVHMYIHQDIHHPGLWRVLFCFR